ncbi:SpeB Arginase/agmatinase/formimionoglutamate hydrolase, arginase family [Candidatus Nanopelagicaceae bacterium]
MRKIALMSVAKLSSDPNWPRANTLLTSTISELAIIGVPASATALSPTSAHLTPAAIREALAKYSTYAGSNDTELQESGITDLGDIESPDHEAGEARVASAVAGLLNKHKILLALGGDNSITYSVAAGIFPDLSKVGLITFDAHHDLRDGNSNGSPIWRLIEAGLPGENIVQIGLSDFANSGTYAKRAKTAGITTIHRAELRDRKMSDVVAQALEIAGAEGREIYVDIDVDVCDRSVAPACPASVPGGISADELRQAANLISRDSRVRAIDITEIDAVSDAADGRTVRLAALLVLEIAAGLAASQR